MITRTAGRRRGARPTAFIVSVLATLATAFVVATPAHAASDSWYNGYLRLNSTCSGLGFTNRVDNRTVASGIVLRVYYSSSQGGTNCANLINQSGRSRLLRIYISFPSADGGGAWDEGRYSSYAGSVLLKGTAGSCIDIYMEADGRELPPRTGVHCG